MILVYPEGSRAKVITFEELQKKLTEAYVAHKHNEKIKLAKCMVTQEDINFVISYWVSELPGLFTKALDTKSNVTISYSTYPRYFEEETQFLVGLFRKAYPSFHKILQSMDVRIEFVNLEYEYPQVQIKTDELIKFVNCNHDMIDIEEIE